MCIINYSLLQGKEREQINKEITRNESISDEVVSLGMEIELVKEVIIDNLMFDYLTLDDEIVKLYSLTKEFAIHFAGLRNDIYHWMKVKMDEELTEDEIEDMDLEEMAKSLIRINKRLILSRVEAEYPDIYSTIKDRANKTTNKIIGGLL